MGKAIGFFLTEKAWVGIKPYDTETRLVRTEELTRAVHSHTTMEGVEVIVCADGFVAVRGVDAFPMGAGPRFEAAKRLATRLNAWIVLVHTHLYLNRRTGFEKEFLTPHNLFEVTPLPDGVQHHKSLRGLRLFAGEHNRPMEGLRQRASELPCLPAQFLRAGVVDRNTIQLAFESYDKVLQMGDSHLLELLNEYARAAWWYEQHDNNGALVVAWTACESLLISEWRSYVNSNEESKVRKAVSEVISDSNSQKKLIKLKEFSMANATKMLAHIGRIETGLKTELDEVRIRRNSWIHHMEQSSGEVASKTIECLENLLKVAKGVHLKIPLIKAMSNQRE